MPSVNVVFYREDDGSVPVADWSARLLRKAKIKCVERLERLKQIGHEIRRPEADYLRDGIYDLRVRFQSLHYRLLHFYHGRTTIVLAHGLTKERMVPVREIEVALARKARFEADPDSHTRHEV
jgi:phage-related protein